jgi:hypothetical protein
MDIEVFPASELPIALGAVRAIDPAPTPVQDRFLETIARLHRTSLDARTLPVPSPAALAAAITDPHRRKRLLQLAVVMTMVDGEVERAPAASVAALARTLGVDEAATDTLRSLAAHRQLLTRVDLTRRLLGRYLAEAWHEEKLGGLRRMMGPLLGSQPDEPEVSWRYKQLGLLPEGTFGRAFWQHCTTRRFGFPGEPSGIPERMVFHDLGHVLSGYDTNPEGEIQQAAFQSGFIRNDGFAFLFFGIIQFHLGVKITPIAEPEVGYLDVDKVLTALQRGAACRVDLSDHWDFWPAFSRPLEEVRAELGIPALPRAH